VVDSVGGGGGALAQPHSIPTISALAIQRQIRHGSRYMIWFLLESLGALALLVLIVWWTMFSGRRHGELVPAEAPPLTPPEAAESEQNRP
jgi:hypothetical protein